MAVSSSLTLSRTCLYNYKGLVSGVTGQESRLVGGPLTTISIFVGVSVGFLGPIFENLYFSLRFLVHSSRFSSGYIVESYHPYI